MSKYTHIIKQHNPELASIYERAGSPSKVMCVGLDYAKTNHTAMICNGEGLILKSAFDIRNTPEGLDFLVERVGKICRKHSISLDNVFFGGEDCGNFSKNFIEALRQREFAVFRVDPSTAKIQRTNFQASSDKLDLLGIVKTLIDRRCAVLAPSSEAIVHLRSLMRHRDSLVETQTAESNRIHDQIDMLFPGFLDEKLSGIPPFSAASLWLMGDRFSVERTKRRQRKTLIGRLRTLGLNEPAAKAAQLQDYASQVLLPPPEMTGVLQSCLAEQVALYKSIAASIAQIEKAAAKVLAKTEGAFLTTFRGTGIVLAAKVASEIGPVRNQPSLRRLTSYSGIVPRSKQTGGEESPPRHGSVSKRCNHRLKNGLVQCGNHMGLHGPADLMEDHGRRTANGQHADFGISRRYLRIGMHLMRNHCCYLPEAVRNDPDKSVRRDYYLELWPKLRDKWRKAGALEDAFKKTNPLGEWKECIESLYNISMPLK